MSLTPFGRIGPLLLLLAACGAKSQQGDAAAAHAVAASDYDRTCADVAECTAVYEGALGCCPFGCPNAAIRDDAKAAYQRDLAQRTPVCNPTPPCEPPFCSDGRVACVSGTCQVLRPDGG